MFFNLTRRFTYAFMPLVVLPMVVPSAVVAQTRINAEVLLEPSEAESYKVFIARAEANAAVKVQALFDQDLLRTEVRVTVLGQKGVAIAPILRLQVSRQDWTAFPDPEIWSIYFPESRNLLLFDGAPPARTAEPETEQGTPPTDRDAAPTVFEDQVPDTNSNDDGDASTNGNRQSRDGEGITIVQQTPGEISMEEIKAAIEAGTLTDANFEEVTAAEVLEAIEAGTLTIIKSE